MIYYFGSTLVGAAVYAYYKLNSGRQQEALNMRADQNCDQYQRIQTILDKSLEDCKVSPQEDYQLILVDTPEPCFKAFGSKKEKEKGIIASVSYCRELTNNELSFIIKHEITHIEKNHSLKIPAFSLLAGISTLVFSRLFGFTPLMSIIATIFSTVFTVSFTQRFNEYEADARAIEYSCVNERIGGINAMQAQRDDLKQLKAYFTETGNWRRFLISDKGEYYPGLFSHPSFLTRISNIKALISTTPRT